MEKNGKYNKVNVVKKLSDYLIEYRKEHNLTREGLAFEVSISPRQLANIENCNAKCKIDTLSKIFNALNIDVEEILKDSDD